MVDLKMEWRSDSWHQGGRAGTEPRDVHAHEAALDGLEGSLQEAKALQRLERSPLVHACTASAHWPLIRHA
jgi:hypothetical protein